MAIRRNLTALSNLWDTFLQALAIFSTRAGRFRRTQPDESVVRLTIVQYGDYAEGYKRLSEGGAENYYAQRYTVEFVGLLAGRDNIENLLVITVAKWSARSGTEVISGRESAEI